MKKKIATILFTFICLNNIAQIQPSITFFSPTSGPIGTIVTITGTNFNSVSTNNIVFFGATRAHVITASPTNLTVSTPTGATYKYISVTNITTNLTAFSAKQFVTTFADCNGINTNSFAPNVDFITGSSPKRISIGDLDGDGKPELAIANGTSNTVSVFLNTSSNGTFFFAPKVDFSTGIFPRFVLTCDLDGDGLLDLITTNTSSNTVSIMKNTSSIGSISFASKIDFTAGPNPHFVSVGDLDNDGKPDLAIANSPNTISIIKNISSNGSILFAPKVDYISGNTYNGSYPSSISVDDIDGDGKPDLSVSNAASSTLSIFLNTTTSGTISFAPKIDFSIGNSGANQISVGDLDADGKPDIAITGGSNSDNVAIIKNTSTIGNISFSAILIYGTGGSPGGISIADLNGDGKPDLAIANLWSTISVFKNIGTTGNISFAPKTEYMTGSAANSVSIGDLNEDGKPDFAVTMGNINTVSVFSNLVTIAPPTVLTDTSFCGTGIATLKAFGAGQSEDYKWYDSLSGGTLLQTNSSTFISPSISLTSAYYVTIYNTISLCESPSRTPVTVNVFPLSVIPSITQNGTLLTSSSSMYYQWYLDGFIILGASAQNYIATQNGNYTVLANGGNDSCSTFSSTVNVTNIGINELSSNNVFVVTPNPFNIQTTISFNKEIKNGSVKIMDGLGRELKIINFTGNELIIEKGTMSAGIYFLKMMYGNNDIVNRMIVIQ